MKNCCRLTLTAFACLLMHGSTLLLPTALAFTVDPTKSSGRRAGVVSARPTAPSPSPSALESTIAKSFDSATLSSSSDADTSKIYQSAAFVPPAAAKVVPNSMEMPRHVQPDIARARTMLQLELIVGRTAMVSAVLLFLVEVTTGQSLPEQISSVMN